ncbi:cupin domain-containing protein [Bradyrhizobium sp.]|uniref:cupin domain-containing protein n=1 Tax=Bradyrhizobium sp. TaxID=376 RepID=UPI002602336C|nr:cupin domain-containing protein [Bradyrhizobium sp.]
MKIHCTRLIFPALAILGLAFTAVAADGPAGNVGFKSSKPTVVDLGPEFSPMNGWQLRLRVLTIEPGGRIGMHSHKDRPSVVYFLQGTDTVTRNDGSSQTFHAGDTTGEPGTTVHWHKNDGKDDVILVTADIIKAAPSK